ncbi:GTP pyrophosphokinase [Finegoldia magna]|uniref:GTP pyrophosphokinase n=1 Tax=Finegoldia magna TaxID=1260 RepID=A0A2N6SSZ1_FINMA|nr:GTP pyrophosphokinase [Finegoldia magna]OXZ24735.1 GTP pyrophosphokinase [Finegoldia magna]PMC60146.1 GTP pyrophosphokinase [Finegoldia magna]
MLNYLRAFFIMLNAHKGQKDKGGHAYFLHPLRVSKKISDRRYKIVALLHDVLEDSDKYTINDFDFLDSEQKDALIKLTHLENVGYMDYIKNIKSNSIARKVKLMDLEDNMNLNRLICFTEKDFKRVEKYKKARDYLLA